MIKTIFQEANAFTVRAKKLGQSFIGRTATSEEIALLHTNFGKILPDWYRSLIAKVPLIHMEIGWQAFQPEGAFDGITYVEIYQPRDMIYESFKAYPGIPILEHGYVCIGGDPIGSGDPYFVHFQSNQSAVYQIFLDAGDNPEQILKYGKVQVAASLDDFFKKGIVLE